MPPLYAPRSLAWLIGFDLLWTIPEVATNVGSVLLIPLCFAGTGVPIYRIQRAAGDSRLRAAIKALPCAIAAALPFPVCGTALGVALLGLARAQAGRGNEP